MTTATPKPVPRERRSLIALLLSPLIGPGETLIRVKSWRPSLGAYGPEWPTMLVEMASGSRMTATPVWDWQRIKMFGKTG